MLWLNGNHTLISSKNGPTQCNNCQLHGHGRKNCTLQPRCAKCAGKHEQLPVRYQTQITNSAYEVINIHHQIAIARTVPITSKLKQSSQNENIQNEILNSNEQFNYFAT